VVREVHVADDEDAVGGDVGVGQECEGVRVGRHGCSVATRGGGSELADNSDPRE
jgi:hypothetical protein